MDPRVTAAVNLLKQCKQQGKTYYEATQVLQQQGYSSLEIGRASDQFSYADALPITNSTQLSPTGEPDAQSADGSPIVALPLASSITSTPQSATVGLAANGNEAVVSFDGVESSLTKFVIRRLWIVALALAAAGALVILFKNPVLVIFPLLLFLGYIKATYENGLFEAFAVANNFNYSKKNDGSAAGQDGLIFRVGHSPQYSDIVSGRYKAWSFLLFMYRYTIGYGRNSHTYHRAVMSVNFATPLPSFVLRRHKLLQLQGDEGESLRQNGYTQKLELEGDFDDHFRVYIRPDSQIDVLSLLAPDIMQPLMGLDKYELEMTETGVLHIYCYGYLTNKQSLMDIYKILELITGPIGRYANRAKELQHLEAPPQAVDTGSSNIPAATT